MQPELRDINTGTTLFSICYFSCVVVMMAFRNGPGPPQWRRVTMRSVRQRVETMCTRQEAAYQNRMARVNYLCDADVLAPFRYIRGLGAGMRQGADSRIRQTACCAAILHADRVGSVSILLSKRCYRNVVFVEQLSRASYVRHFSQLIQLIYPHPLLDVFGWKAPGGMIGKGMRPLGAEQPLEHPCGVAGRPLVWIITTMYCF
ncbi:hypothetical protein PSPO01_09389 [Paraphaeosphaeria sporulosa]